MSERDQLWGIIAAHHVWNGDEGCRGKDDAADAILAAGYRKPRTITTAEELDTLADRSVVMESQPESFGGMEVMAGVFHKFPHTGWQCVASHKCYGSAEIDLPATVLYEPTA